ncbi:hypothetical protein BDZ97DRAFT_1862258 [Flammula alnicola]|nr:hypothetical protein BDZ97DRAFT_1862258 [Flammula alnicola]
MGWFDILLVLAFRPSFGIFNRKKLSRYVFFHGPLCDTCYSSRDFRAPILVRPTVKETKRDRPQWCPRWVDLCRLLLVSAKLLASPFPSLDVAWHFIMRLLLCIQLPPSIPTVGFVVPFKCLPIYARRSCFHPSLSFPYTMPTVSPCRTSIRLYPTLRALFLSNPTNHP